MHNIPLSVLITITTCCAMICTASTLIAYLTH